jgi:hypothetical protein
MNDQKNTLYCANHPGIETGLRCNNCDKPICVRCAVKTPTGYRCPECVKGQQKKFETAEIQDYPIALITAFLLALFGGWLVTFLSLLTTLFAGILVFLLTPTYGFAISELIRRLINRRRSKRLFQLTALSIAVGTLPFLLITIGNMFIGPGGFGYLFRIAWQVIYAVTLTSTVYYRLRGLRI